MKFYSLLRKEVKELMTIQTIISLFLSLAIFYLIGNIMGNVTSDLEEKAKSIVICDQDQSDFTKALISELKKEKDIKVKEVTLKSDNYQEELKKLDLESVVIIPKGFSNTILVENKKAELINVSSMNTIAMSGTVSSSTSEQTVNAIKEAMKGTLLLYKDVSVSDAALIQNPVEEKNITIVGDNSAEISVAALSSFVSTQGLFVPIVIFLLVMYASQMIISAIATEKVDKTLETLLSAPVSRVSVLSAKMLAAALVAALNAIVYMIGFSRFMNSLTGDTGSGSGKDISKYVSELGLKLQGTDYIFLGMQMFLTILIALSVSLILGALAKDVKSAQSLILPVMFAAMIPYMITLFIDIESLSIVPKTLIYAIPFTHTFVAVDNILFAKDALFWGGFAYQIVFLIVCMFFAVRVFMTDKLFTISLSFGQKRAASGKKGLNLLKKK